MLTRQPISRLHLITVCVLVLFPRLMVSIQGQHCKSYSCINSNSIEVDKRNLGMIQHLIGSRVQKCTGRSPPIPNGLADGCSCVQLCSSEHSGGKNQDVWKLEMRGDWTVPILHKRAQVMLLQEAHCVPRWQDSSLAPLSGWGSLLWEKNTVNTLFNDNVMAVT